MSDPKTFSDSPSTISLPVLGGWAYALDLAGWPRDRPVWTGSCPCQPFSAAGKGAGFDDERHLWPSWRHLIAQCQPAVVFGEQVASKGADPWVDLVHADMEGLGHAFGCIPFPAAGIGAPQIRERIYWVADTHGSRGEAGLPESAQWPQRYAGVAYHRSGEHACPAIGPALGWLANATRVRRREERANASRVAIGAAEKGFSAGSLHGGSGLSWRSRDSFWADADWLLGRDDRWRPVEPGTFPLAHGISGRVGRLCAYGNGIVPQQGAQFILSYCEARGLMTEAHEALAA